MTPLQRIIGSVASLLMMALIFHLVRRRKLREEYSILWLAAGLVMLLVAAEGRLVYWVASALNIQHPAYGLFVLALLVGIVLAIHFTVVLSRLTAQNWRLTQEVGLSAQRIDELERRLAAYESEVEKKS